MSNIANEMWNPIVGFEGLYEVSNFGRVRSLERKDGMGRRKRGMILKQTFDGKANYLKVGLWKNGKAVTHSVHRLVAVAFLPNNNQLPEVNHKDECKTNNHASNLEWCDRRYNNNYGSKCQSNRGSCNSQSKITEAIVRAIREEAKTISIQTLAEKYELSRSHVYHIVDKTRWGWVV